MRSATRSAQARREPANPSGGVMAKCRKANGAGEGSTASAPSSSERETLDASVVSLSGLSADQLRLQWRNHLGGIAPAHIAGWLLMRVLAYRIQAMAFGDLDRAILRRLREIRDEAFESGDARPFATRGPTTREYLVEFLPRRLCGLKVVQPCQANQIVPFSNRPRVAAPWSFSRGSAGPNSAWSGRRTAALHLDHSYPGHRADIRGEESRLHACQRLPHPDLCDHPGAPAPWLAAAGQPGVFGGNLGGRHSVHCAGRWSAEHCARALRRSAHTRGLAPGRPCGRHDDGGLLGWLAAVGRPRAERVCPATLLPARHSATGAPWRWPRWGL